MEVLILLSPGSCYAPGLRASDPKTMPPKPETRNGGTVHLQSGSGKESRPSAISRTVSMKSSVSVVLTRASSSPTVFGKDICTLWAAITADSDDAALQTPRWAGRHLRRSYKPSFMGRPKADAANFG